MEQSGADHHGRKKLVLKNLPFADKLAHQFHQERRHLGIELEEFIAAARFGLCDAALRFNSERNNNFRTFAYFRIRGAMYDLLKQTGGISRAYFGELASREARERKQKTSSPARLPYALAHDTDDLRRLTSILEDFGIRVEVGRDKATVSICYSLHGNPETDSVERNMKEYIRGLVRRLPERERSIIQSHYFEDKSYEDMRDRLGQISRSWLCRLHARALESLRVMMVEDEVQCAQRAAVHEN